MLRLALCALVATAGCAARSRPDPLPRLGHTLYRVADPAPTPATDGDLDRALTQARVVFAGEQHDDPHHHAFELELFERLHRLDPSLGLGLEMLPAPFQPALDDYLAGRTDDAAFLAAVDWPRTWGYPFSFYRPLLAFCRAHHLPAFALNAPRELSKKIAHLGTEGLSEPERAQLPEMVPGPPEHRAQLEEAFKAHGGKAHSNLGPDAVQHFYQAQLLWDETMAEHIARALRAENAPHRLLVVAGEGHSVRFAIPQRAARRGITPPLIVLPRYPRDLAPTPAADFLWILKR